MSIEVYCDYHSPTIRFIKHDGAWYIMDATHNGWVAKRPWYPSPAVVKNIATEENRVNLHNSWLAAEMYGIPKEVYAA
ncbi:hypothetical protein [Rhizobium cremeum]|uniref:hypothetical protein n=1 Tax=Rhizobium cremeum TaxID=2813827 RepID=UPI0039E01412